MLPVGPDPNSGREEPIPRRNPVGRIQMMIERASCSCAICKLEQTLLRELHQAQYVQYFTDLVAGSPILSGFPATLELLERMRQIPADDEQMDSSDAILGELLRPGRSDDQEIRQYLVLLLLMPSLHKTARQIAAGFPFLGRDDIAQNLMVTILEVLASPTLRRQQSHFAFTITRLVRRQSFRWALNEARHTTKPEPETPDASQPAAVEANGNFETQVFLREFLQGCLSRGLLTEAEHQLLMSFKVDGIGSEVLAAREGLSEVALRRRMQRIIDKLRRIAQTPSPIPSRASASCQTRRSVWAA